MVTDLSSNAFGKPWGYTRSWSNRLGIDYDGPYGVNWFLKEVPLLVQNGPNTLALIGVVPSTLWFDLTAGVWKSRFQNRGTLVANSAGHQFIHTDLRGKRTVFHDFTVATGLQGKFLRSMDPHGGTAHTVEAQYDTSSRLEKLTQSATGIGTVSYEYAYHNSGAQINRLISATLVVNTANVRRALFEYHDNGSANGVISDLKQVAVETWQSPCGGGAAAWSPVQKTYYRYYTAASATGYARGLKYVVNPDALARMTAASLNPDTATDTQVAAYADHYFEYDSTRRVTKEVTNGGLITTVYERTWFSDTQQVEELTIKLPPVPVAQNGANVTDTRRKKFSAYGQLLWEQDERGYITGYSYDQLNGALTQRIDDAGSSASPPWTPVSGTRLNLVTSYTNDALGRQVQELGPEHEIDLSGTATTIRRARWTVFQDDTHEVWQAGGSASGSGFSTFMLMQPVNVLKLDPAGRTTASIQAVRGSGTSGKLDRCDTFPQTSWSRWTQFNYDQNSRLEWQRVYFDTGSSKAARPRPTVEINTPAGIALAGRLTCGGSRRALANWSVSSTATTRPATGSTEKTSWRRRAPSRTNSTATTGCIS